MEWDGVDLSAVVWSGVDRQSILLRDRDGVFACAIIILNYQRQIVSNASTWLSGKTGNIDNNYSIVIVVE